MLPSGKTSRVRTITTYEGELAEASAGDSVIITLEDEIDVSRGDMIVRRHNLPQVASQFECTLCWMSEEPLNPDGTYLLQHTTRQVRGHVAQLNYRIDVDTLHREPAQTLQLNEIGRVKLTTTQPLFFDPYQINRATGGFILIDPYTNNTVAAGMIRRQAQELEEIVTRQPERPRSTNVTWESTAIMRGQREERNGHQAAVLWFTGLSGSGKTTVARLLERRLFAAGRADLLPGWRQRAPRAQRRSGLLRGRPPGEHPPRGRSGETGLRPRHHRHLHVHLALRARSRRLRGRCCPRDVSSRSTPSAISNSASAATPRACTPGRCAARSPSSPASPRPMKSRPPPSSSSKPTWSAPRMRWKDRRRVDRSAGIIERR